MKPELDCKEVSRLISSGLDEALPTPERARLRLHFVICETCRNVNEQMQFLRRAMRDMGKDDSPRE
jgi:predicted anti-sigma-YlaC factor YlaD